MSGGRAAAVWSAGTGGGAAAGRRLQPAVGSGTGGSGGGEGSTERSRRRVRAAEAAGGRRAPDPAAFSPTPPAAGRGGRGRGRAGPGRLLALGAALLVSSLLASLPAPGGGWEAGGRGLSERGPPGVERGRQGAAAAPRKRVRRGGCGPGLPEFPGPSGGRTEGVNAPSEVDPRAAAARRSVSNLPRGAAAASGRPAGPWGEPGVL